MKLLKPVIYLQHDDESYKKVPRGHTR